MKNLDKITKKDFRDGIVHCLKGGLINYAPLGSAGNTYYIHNERTEKVSRVSQVSLRLYNKDVELLLTDTLGDFLFYGRYHCSHGLKFLTDEYFRIFKNNLEWIKTVAPKRNPDGMIKSVQKLEFKKAFLVIPYWSDDKGVYSNQQHRQPEYAVDAGKAKYQFYLHLEMDEDDWFRYRSLRWPEMDLFPPVLDPILKDIPESATKKAKHTYAAESHDPGHRNYYNGSVDDKDFKILINKGLAERNESRDNILSKGSTYYHLTDKGVKAVMSTREIKRHML